jgi:hypothetical protein
MEGHEGPIKCEKRWKSWKSWKQWKNLAGTPKPGHGKIIIIDFDCQQVAGS